MGAEQLHAWIRRTANFVSIEHDIPLAAAQAFVHGCNLLTLMSALPDAGDREAQETALIAVMNGFAEALEIPPEKCQRISDEIGRAYQSLPQ